MAASNTKAKTKKRQKMHVRMGDTVQVISGKDKGVVGEVKAVLPHLSRVVVEGVNVRTKHVKPQQEGEKGKIVSVEAPIHSSNVMLYSKKESCVSRVGYSYAEDGSKVRVLKKTGEILG